VVVLLFLLLLLRSTSEKDFFISLVFVRFVARSFARSHGDELQWRGIGSIARFFSRCTNNEDRWWRGIDSSAVTLSPNQPLLLTKR
jgi:hypothetical protein